jgi:DNA-binding CsgD family transcriptional regulator
MDWPWPADPGYGAPVPSRAPPFTLARLGTLSSRMQALLPASNLHPMGDHGRDDQPTDGRVGTDGSVLAFLRVLAADPDGATLAAALARGLLAEWAPGTLSVYLVDAAGEALVDVGSYGIDTTDSFDYSRVPLTVPTPFSQAVRTGEERFWTLLEGAADYPAVAGWVARHPAADTAEAVVIPIWSRGRTVGVLSVLFATPVDRTWRLRSALDSAAAALAVWALSSEHAPSARPRGSRGVAPTPRQQRILDQLAAGRTNAQIAADLQVSVGTVKTDLAHLFRIYAVRDRQSLVDAAAAAAPLDAPA